MELFPVYEELFSSVLHLIFFTLVFAQFFMVIFFRARLAFHKHKYVHHIPPVSIIIAARNEEDNLFHLLPEILEQDYPEFEVIVVNHQSIDDSEHILKAFERRYSHLKVINLEKSAHLKNGKKLPITIGVKGAKHEHLLFTDADCKPNSKQWLHEMASQFTDKKQLILGYGPYKKSKGLLNKIVRLDTAQIAINYLSFAKAGLPYMGVGRNLAYTKSLFLKVDGFKSHYGLQSGDDDLFVQEAARKRNYSICLTPEAFCYSEAKKTWKDWYRQKTRHFTTTEKYPVIKKWLLGIYPLTLLLMYITFVTLLLLVELNIFTLALFGFIFILKWVVDAFCFAKLVEKEFIWLLPFWDILYALLAPIIYYTTEKATEGKWK